MAVLESLSLLTEFIEYLLLQSEDKLPELSIEEEAVDADFIADEDRSEDLTGNVGRGIAFPGPLKAGTFAPLPAQLCLHQQSRFSASKGINHKESGMNLPFIFFAFSGLSLSLSTLTRLAPKEALLVACAKMGTTLPTILGGLQRDFDSPFIGTACIDGITLIPVFHCVSSFEKKNYFYFKLNFS